MARKEPPEQQPLAEALEGAFWEHLRTTLEAGVFRKVQAYTSLLSALSYGTAEELDDAVSLALASLPEDIAAQVVTQVREAWE